MTLQDIEDLNDIMHQLSDLVQVSKFSWLTFLIINNLQYVVAKA